MNRNELVERIRDALLDPWTESIEDYHLLTPITLTYAAELLADIRNDESSAELDPEDRLPPETTPELVQEVMNCIIQWSKHQYRVNRLARWLTDTENVCLYSQYRGDYLPDGVDIVPVDFLYNSMDFPFALLFNEKPDVAFLLSIGKKSADTFSTEHEYCWFDKRKWQLFSTDTPYADGIIDAEAFATYAIESGNKDLLNEIASEMDAELWDEIFPHQ